MTTDERIITAVDVHDGAYVDGSEFHKLLEKTEEAGVKVEAVTADKAYFRKDILDDLKQKDIESVIPVSSSSYKIDETMFSYNKDSDEWFCRIGNRTVKKRARPRRKTVSHIGSLFTPSIKKDARTALTGKNAWGGHPEGDAS